MKISSANAATAAANGNRLRSSFQIMTTWAAALPELGDGTGPASRAFLAAVTVASVERDQRRYADLLTLQDYQAAQVVLGCADEVWNELDACRRMRYPQSISNFEIIDSLLVDHESERGVSKKFDLHRSTVTQRYKGALKVLDDQFGHLCTGCDSPDPPTGCYTVIIGWHQRLKEIEAIESIWRPAPSWKERCHPLLEPKRKNCSKASSDRHLDIWSCFRKTEIGQAAGVLVHQYRAKGGQITQCKPGINYLSDSYWLLRGAAARREHETNVERYLGGDREFVKATRRREASKPEPSFDKESVVQLGANDNAIFAPRTDRTEPQQDKIVCLNRTGESVPPLTSSTTFNGLPCEKAAA